MVSLGQADAWIHNGHYTADRLKIERLSGDRLSMDQCYINLAIMEQQASGVASGEGPKSEDTPPRSSPFSLSARLRIETPDENIQVKLANIFDARKGPDGREIRPRRILIRGRAGVGKTTLCKKIVYEFIHGPMEADFQKWKSLFDRILWVPLRTLKRKPEKGYNLEGLFLRDFFSFAPDREILAKKLETALHTTKFYKTLFVLDGLDEVSEGLDTESEMYEFLHFLLQRPNVVVTSRPSARPRKDLNLDLELETIGFFEDQVQSYIDMAFTDPRKINEVQSFVQGHWLIQSLVRIPIQLDALCYTWSDPKEGTVPQTVPDTMSGMYKSIEKKLWKKDAIRLEKRHDGELVTPSQIQTTGVEDLVLDEIYFIEGLAFTGLHNDVIDFTSEHRNAVSEHFNLSKFLLDKTLPRLSFLRTSDSSAKFEDREYHFIHLTFQEYFAARYFVRQWNAEYSLGCLNLNDRKMDRIKAVSFFREHKYTARYDILWRFVAGLLDADGQAGRFIDMIGAEPLDLVGPTHQRLVMHCLSEVSGDLSNRQELESELSQWLMFEYDITDFSLLARESECPDRVLLTVLEVGSDPIKVNILQALGTVRQLCGAVVSALILLIKDEDWSVQSSAAGALGKQSNLSETSVSALVALLKDEHWSIRSSAADALGKQSNLSETSVSALVALLKDEDWSIRSSAADALEKQSSLSEASVSALVLLLKYKRSSVRSRAAKALGNQSNLSEAGVSALVALLKDEDSSIRSRAAKALGNQSNLSEAGVSALIALLKDED